MLCQQCKKHTATVHLTDLVNGEKREKHLCEECAGTEGVTVKQHVSINDVLNSFLSQHQRVKELARIKCPNCGMTFVEFRSNGVLGCPQDYDVFGEELGGLIERAQDGNSKHIGKRPGDQRNVDPAMQERLRLQRELREAVENEDYERAARLRDQLSGKKTT